MTLPGALGRHDDLDLFGLINETIDITRNGGSDDRLLAAATHLLVLSGLLAATLESDESLSRQFESSPGRVPLKTTLTLIADEGPLEDTYYRILAEMVIGQHMAWAVARNTDETQRLRISLEEEGLVPLGGKPLEPAPTADRLENLLPLLAEARRCHQLKADGSIKFEAR